MSIYRKISPETQNDIYATAVTRQPPAHAPMMPAKSAAEEAARSKRRKGTPMDAPLPRTVTWFAKLPKDLQPMELARSYARIVNLLAAAWDDPAATYSYFNELLHDQRGSRQGFPPEVMVELLALRTYYGGLHPETTASWGDLTKRE
jgi:hypothetical protein